MKELRMLRLSSAQVKELRIVVQFLLMFIG